MDPPIKPEESDCCNSGCNPCVFDIYEKQLRFYEKRLANENFNLGRSNCISQTTYTVFKLAKVENHTPDTYLYMFEYVRPFTSRTVNESSLILDYKPGQHFLLKAPCHDSKKGYFTRAYTPIPLYRSPVSFTVLIKLYGDGSMSQYLGKLEVGSETLWRGPYGDFELSFTSKHKLLIAQGTGIAPIFSVIHEIIQNEECETILKLFFCCRSENDILLRNELHEFSSYWNFSYEVFLSGLNDVRAKYNEVIHSVRLGRNNIVNYLVNKCKKDTHVLICGGAEFSQLMRVIVLDAGINNSKVFVF